MSVGELIRVLEDGDMNRYLLCSVLWREFTDDMAGCQPRKHTTGIREQINREDKLYIS